MKKLYLIALLGLLFNSVGVLSVGGKFNDSGIPLDFDRTIYSELAKFVDRYRCPESLQENSEDHFDKGGEIDRIINAERLRVVISKFNLDCLTVAEKYLYKGTDGTYRVLSKKVDSDGGLFDSCSLTVKEFQQLVKVIAITGCSDLHYGNIVRDSSTGKITFIDTENISFGYGFRVFNKNGGGFNLILSDMSDPVPEWVKGFVRDSIAPFQDKNTLLSDRQYDKDLGIDLFKVQKEFLSFKFIEYMKVYGKKLVRKIVSKL